MPSARTILTIVVVVALYNLAKTRVAALSTILP